MSGRFAFREFAAAAVAAMAANPRAVKDPHASFYMFQPAVEAFPTGTTYSAKSDIVADS